MCRGGAAWGSVTRVGETKIIFDCVNGELSADRSSVAGMQLTWSREGTADKGQKLTHASEQALYTDRDEFI